VDAEQQHAWNEQGEWMDEEWLAKYDSWLVSEHGWVWALPSCSPIGIHGSCPPQAWGWVKPH
jgi:hypothetical protein